MPIRCPQCGREVPADDVNLEQALGRCKACNIVFSCAQAPGAAPRPAKPQIGMPPNFTLTHEGPEFVLTRRWYTPAAWGLVLFCMVWDGIVGFFIVMAWTHNGPLGVKLFPLIHGSVGVLVTYLCAAMFVNRTTIRVDPQGVSVAHGPLPWPGAASFQRGELQQLFCEEKVTSTKNGVNYTYNVVAIRRDNTRVPFVSSLDKPDQALFIEEKVEALLGIQDRPVAGEMRPLA